MITRLYRKHRCNGRNEVNDHYHNNKYVRELRRLIDERTAALTEIEESIRLPNSHPGAPRLQQALGPDSNESGNLQFHAGEGMAPVGIRVSDGKLHSPFGELDEIIGKLIVPAATTMQALSKEGTHRDFRPRVRLRVRVMPKEHEAGDMEYM